MTSSSYQTIQTQLRRLGSPEIAEHSQRFFKTGPGQYGEGDRFIGIRVPVLRKFAKQHRELPIPDVERFLQSAIHEERLLALLMLVTRYARGDAAIREEVFDLYCRNMAFVNNWDLVDCSAHKIIGPHLEGKSKRNLHQWSNSKNLWERRIAIIATYAYIKQDEFDETLAIAKTLLRDQEDLIHKAVGWMLREIGKRDQAVEETFLMEHCRVMPRTMLRYAIERFPEAKRKRYLAGR
jgi:3-methyladenine DNA glycosylase AlkD